jgi:hypothetical protein
MREITLLLFLLLAAGCTPVKPWERGRLAKWHMALEPDPLDARFKAHVYESKEGSSGGYGVGGGGCGCN